jgi:hypothetical protein
MRARTERRLAKIEAAVRDVLLPDALVKLAFDTFHSSGKLPEHDALATAVVERALFGDDPEDFGFGSRFAGHEQSATWVRAPVRETAADCVPPREILFREAIFGDVSVLDIARKALAALVADGADVTEPAWLQDQLVPAFGTLGLSLLGWSQTLAIPPYEDQARRLLDRVGDLQRRLEQEPESGLGTVRSATETFYEAGGLPDDPLRDAVLANAEMRTLMRHAAGEDVASELAAFGGVAMAQGEDRERAIARLIGLVARRG